MAKTARFLAAISERIADEKGLRLRRPTKPGSIRAITWLEISHVMVDFQPLNGYIPTMHVRRLAAQIRESLQDTPVVFVQGPRQSGKSTLVQSLIADGYPAEYLSFDTAAALAAATADPEGFLAGFDGPIAIDEVQRVPALALAIKGEVDKDRRPGRFLLTGSENVRVVLSFH